MSDVCSPFLSSKLRSSFADQGRHAKSIVVKLQEHSAGFANHQSSHARYASFLSTVKKPEMLRPLMAPYSCKTWLLVQHDLSASLLGMCGDGEAQQRPARFR
jgi:hypothetical protein